MVDRYDSLGSTSGTVTTVASRRLRVYPESRAGFSLT